MLSETLKLAVNTKNAVGMWGPYEIRKEAFDLGVNGSGYSMEELSVTRLMTVLPERTESRSIVSTPWLAWKNFIPTVDCLGRDLKCGALMAPNEF